MTLKEITSKIETLRHARPGVNPSYRCDIQVPLYRKPHRFSATLSGVYLTSTIDMPPWLKSRQLQAEQVKTKAEFAQVIYRHFKPSTVTKAQVARATRKSPRNAAKSGSKAVYKAKLRGFEFRQVNFYKIYVMPPSLDPFFISTDSPHKTDFIAAVYNYFQSNG